MIKIAGSWIYPSDCQKAPNDFFVYGDNFAGWGTGGQAIIRSQPNAIGIPTKQSPYVFLRDPVPSNFINILEIRTARVDALSDGGATIWFPMDGIGTGRAELFHRAPEYWKILRDHLIWLGENHAKDFEAYSKAMCLNH